MRVGMSSPPDISSSVSIADSSTPLMLDSPVFVSDENPEYDVIASENDSGYVNTEIEQVATEDQNVQQGEEDVDDSEFHMPKRSKTFEGWDDFQEFIEDGLHYAICLHCGKKLSRGKTKQTASMLRHRYSCPSVPALHSGNFDMEKMREAIAHWILMHEHPFTIVEEEGFNIMLKHGMPEWQEISQSTVENDSVQVYELERKKLKNLLRRVQKVSLTIDMWKSENQKIEYMLLTGHWIDANWKLQKRVLNCVHIPPPQRGIEISASIFKCVKEWGIEQKVHTISVDNASNNDGAVRILKDDFGRSKKLLGGGKLFHVPCCAHVLNLMVQDGLNEIVDITENIRDSVEFVTWSDEKALLFAEIAQQLQISGKKLLHDCGSRWDYTYEMLSCAVKFKEVFSRFQDREPHYDFYPSSQDWEKVEKVCTILEKFWTAMHIISGSDYPTSNLFLQEILKMKKVLDAQVNDEDDFIRGMVARMKLKFNKYWDECNLLISIAAILDPRQKMRAIEFAFPKMYPPHEAQENIIKVQKAIFDLYEEYVAIAASASAGADNSTFGASASQDPLRPSSSFWDDFDEYCAEVETNESHNELADYLDKARQPIGPNPNEFDCLDWWRINRILYPVLSQLACDILAIPITTVASKAAFSVGTRVIDSYRTLLAPEIVQVLMCAGDWCRNLHGVKKKQMETLKEYELPKI